MSLEPDKIYLHDPHGVFEEDGHSGMEIVMWSEDRIDENDYEYIRSQNLAKPDAYSLLAEVRALIQASNNLIRVSKKTGSWNLVCNEEIEFEKALQKVSEHFS